MEPQHCPPSLAQGRIGGCAPVSRRTARCPRAGPFRDTAQADESHAGLLGLAFVRLRDPNPLSLSATRIRAAGRPYRLNVKRPLRIAGSGAPPPKSRPRAPSRCNVVLAAGATGEENKMILKLISAPFRAIGQLLLRIGRLLTGRR
jgi:hypothetical protein